MAHRLFSLGQTGKLLNARIFISKSIFFHEGEIRRVSPMLNATKHEILVVDDDAAIETASRWC